MIAATTAAIAIATGAAAAAAVATTTWQSKWYWNHTRAKLEGVHSDIHSIQHCICAVY